MVLMLEPVIWTRSVRADFGANPNQTAHFGIGCQMQPRSHPPNGSTPIKKKTQMEMYS